MAAAHRLIFFLFPCTLWGFDFFPWFGTDFTFDITPFYIFRYFPSLNTDFRHFSTHETGNIIGSEIHFTGMREYTAGMFVSLTKTSRMEFGLNSVNFMAGTQFFNDRLGDFLTASAYFMANGNASRATRDLILYHSARWELEWHLSVGKERTVGPSWSYRGWLDLGFGTGTSGSPYLKGLLFLEKNYCDCSVVGVFAKTWIGLGNRPLKPPFYGYGSVAHRNLDVGMRYTYMTPYWGCFGADVSLGLVAVNYPRLPVQGRVFWNFNLGP